MCKFRPQENDFIQDLLYEDGVKKLQTEFDIVRLFKQLRHVELLSNIFLSKYQKSLLPYFKQNLLHFEPDSQSINNLSFSENQGNRPEEFYQDLLQIIKKSKKSKISRRIIKSIIDAPAITTKDNSIPNVGIGKSNKTNKVKSKFLKGKKSTMKITKGDTQINKSMHGIEDRTVLRL
jgi:hypothetical protein